MIPQCTYSSLFNVATVGDWGCNDNSKNTLKNISSKKPELILALGDLSYQRTAECWLEIISSVDNITSIVRGDHDNDFRTSQYMEHFNMSSEFYSFNQLNIHFLIMSTELPYELGSNQYEFVKSDLENTSTNSSIKWIIIAYHQPAYISPNDCQGCSPRVTLREVYHPLFDRYNVDLVLQAHSHNYERSYPILYNNKDSEN
ncbi:MAG: metallophosphoesterase, partial [Nitrososphaeraceae archaeon]|nr:metallophosphoesterase [Nitrososphaeraceae archaeon]